MSLDNIIGGFAQYQRFQSSNNDDPIDRLNHIYTVTLLVVFSVFVSGKQYVGNAIECICPADFTISKREYARSYCWLKNTYRLVNFDRTLPISDQDRLDAEIAYYQWVPIVLLLMAACFKLPNLMWRLFSFTSGMDLNQVASLVTSTQIGPEEKSRETMKHVAEYIDRWLESHRQVQWNVMETTKKVLSKKLCFFFWGRRYGTYLSGLYLLTKFLFVLNVTFIFVTLHYMLGHWYLLMGFRLLPWFSVRATASEVDLWPESPYFPKVTFCDFDVWQLSNRQRHTIQCTIPLNMFNEKIFAFLWIWLWVVMVATVVNFVYWAFKWACGRKNYIHVRRFLKSRCDLITERDKDMANKFAHEYLRRDGSFVLYVILKNSNAVVMGDLVSELWKIYKAKVRAQKSGPKGQGDIMYI